MSNLAGWYPQPDGQQRYWDGFQWTDRLAPGVAWSPPLDTGPPQITTVRHRRNHVVAGLGIVLSAILIAFAVTQPQANFTGPPIAISGLKVVNLTVTPSSGYKLDEQTLVLCLSFAVTLGVLGLLLLVTRVRFLGLIWRLGALAAITLPALLAISYWTFISDPTSGLKEGTDTSFAGQGLAMLADGTRGLAWDITPGIGLYLFTAGVVCAVLASLVPAIRHKDVVTVTAAQ